MGEATFPLAGLRVLEASEGIAGAYAAKLLADQGAEVVKLERPGDGDPLRALGRIPTGREAAQHRRPLRVPQRRQVERDRR